MDFEWDDAKNDACFTDRGFDSAYEDRIVSEDRRWDYGEDRYRLLGAVEGRGVRGDLHHAGLTIRIISARKANRREVREYEQNTVDD